MTIGGFKIAIYKKSIKENFIINFLLKKCKNVIFNLAESLSKKLEFYKDNEFASIKMIDNNGKPFKLSYKNALVNPFTPKEGVDYAYVTLKFDKDNLPLYMKQIQNCYEKVKVHAESNWFKETDEVTFSEPWNEGSLSLKWPSKYVSGKPVLEMLEKTTQKERSGISLETFADLTSTGEVSMSGTYTVKPWVRKTGLDEFKFGVSLVMDKAVIIK